MPHDCTCVPDMSLCLLGHRMQPHANTYGSKSGWTTWDFHSKEMEKMRKITLLALQKPVRWPNMFFIFNITLD